MATIKYEPDFVSPPGATLQDALDERGMSQVELAERTGHAPKVINEIVKGKAAITPETAIQLERVLGIGARFWSNRESRYREFLARQQEALNLKPHLAWAKQFPVREMKKYEFIDAPETDIKLVGQMLDFFGVASPHQFDAVWSEKQPAFRKSSVYSVDRLALIAWLRQGEREAQAVACEDYAHEKFFAALLAARTLTTKKPNEYGPKLKALFSHAGVAIVFVRELPRIRTSGATQWISSKKAMIQLSLRYKTSDHLWFTIFHEAAHILKHPKRRMFVEKIEYAIDPELELEANQFSADLLIPPDSWRAFLQQDRFSAPSAVRFAQSIKIDPGIVIGRLQHEGRLRRDRLNHLKTRLEWV
ncbi:MAG: hypothetical protein AUJ52_01290 [Elusimicrobia bacterium CG1_02_63_36]|nr:MAG: hypothetical protein AUJ52_01290 [Elusimicrobia bacterium CG1_02_63_36]PIP81841.1 MAG: XRE family transcriptional regulator [Elusimicrobia bacterium CG22_combo_CG10-13_8_21_14_all_63_91]PJA11521.1 MAG: XRE family transcriptional regulator [Elusimicrobia bacterium CG_4_10_14_0_2_um_filter_63_34]PJB24356.1 MAG: XRE family transcriptional regulator [Elusimicrobia bacterium CG_4_9_14_3_um_filter_62_55]